MRARDGKDDGRPGDGGRAIGWGFVGIQGALITALLYDASRAPRTHGAVRGLGFLLTVAGVAVMGLASLALGKALRAHPAPPSGAVLRTDGAYRLVRHPIYAGLILSAAGLALVAQTTRTVATVCALWTLLSVKARYEEGLLCERFPEYTEYRRRTPRFVPRNLWGGD